MKHDSESQIQPITTDPLTGEYKLTIPEWMINEYGWYEGMNLEWFIDIDGIHILEEDCLLYTSPSPRDPKTSRMPSSA